MALSREQKEAELQILSDLVKTSKIVVYATYAGLTVTEAQELRRLSTDGNSRVRVAKNRLVKLALANNDGYKNATTEDLTGQLIYGFSDDDEVAPAQVFANFAKTHPSLELKGAIDATGQKLDEDQVKQMAKLPSKDVMRGQLVGTIAAPLSGFVNVLSGNIRGLVNVLNARQAEFE